MILSSSDNSRRKNIKRPKLRLNNLSCIMPKQQQLLFKQLNAVNYRPMHVRESITPCKGIPRRGLRIPGTAFQSFLVDLGFWIPILCGIPDSLSCIPDSKTRNSGFHKGKIYQIPDFTSRNFPDSGDRIPLHGVKIKNHCRPGFWGIRYTGAF